MALNQQLWNGTITRNACQHCGRESREAVCMACQSHIQKQKDLLTKYELPTSQVNDEIDRYLKVYEKHLLAAPNQAKATAKAAAKTEASKASPFVAKMLKNRGIARFQAKLPPICDLDKLADSMATSIAGITRKSRFSKSITRKLDSQEAQDMPKKDAQGNCSTLAAWFAENKKLKASFVELTFFTGRAAQSWSKELAKLTESGYEFERIEGELRLLSRPTDKSEKHLALEAVLGKELSADDFQTFLQLAGAA